MPGFLLYGAVVALTYFFIGPPSTETVFWPPFGLLLGLLLNGSRRHWAATISVALLLHALIATFVASNLHFVLMIAAAEALAAFIAASLVLRETDGRIHFGHLWELGKFSSAVVLSALLSGILLSEVALLAGSPYSFIREWIHWSAALGIAAFLITPLLLSSGGRARTGSLWRETAMAFTLAVLLAALSVGIFFPGFFLEVSLPPRLFLPLSVLVLAALCFGTSGATMGLLFIAALVSLPIPGGIAPVGSSRVDLQACKLEYSIVSPK